MSTGDMFLRVEAARTGTIRGESSDEAHRDEIVVHGWSWAMHSPGTASGPTGRATFDSLRIIKRVDAASTALLSAMRHNENLKEIVLSVRKPGPEPVDYLVVTGELGRISDIEFQTGEDPDDPLVERLTLTLGRITVQYTLQDADGRPGTTTSFTADVRGIA